MIQKVDIQTIADFIIKYCNENGISISHLKLQKLLYYIQAWHLVYFKNQLIFDEVPQAWVNGPVYQSIYNRFKDMGIYDSLELPELSFTTAKESLPLSVDQTDFLNSILNHYGVMPQEKLVYLTHKEKPWNEAREGLQPFEYSDKAISLKTMEQYYAAKKNKQVEHA